MCDEFLRYLFSAFPLSAPELAQQARTLLERPSSLEIPLVKGPFVSLSESFAKGELVEKLAAEGKLHPVMPGLYERTNVAIYLDGMSRGGRGDPNVARKDQVIRQSLELDGYTVIVVQKRDLDDPQAVRLHLRNIAKALWREDLLGKQ